MPINDIWIDSRLKELFIKSKNERIRVQTRKIWSSEVEVQQGSHYCTSPRNSVPEGFMSILETPVNEIFQPKFALEAAFKLATNPSHAINMAQHGSKISRKK